MDGISEMVKGITNAGAGVVALAILLLGAVWLVKSVPKWIANQQASQATTTEVIRANSAAIAEMAKSNEAMAKSNDNVAYALGMLQPLIERSVEKQDKILAEILIIGERTRDCGKKGA